MSRQELVRCALRDVELSQRIAGEVERRMQEMEQGDREYEESRPMVQGELFPS
jgi:hypothetical protein